MHKEPKLKNIQKCTHRIFNFSHVSEKLQALLYYFLLYLNTLIIVQKCTLIIVQFTNNSTNTLIMVQNYSDIYKFV